MSNLTIRSSQRVTRKANKGERRKNKRKQFIAMTSIVFIILFIFSMCVTVIAKGIGISDTSNRGIQRNESIPNDENFIIVHAPTHDVTESIETENSEETTTSEEVTTIEEEIENPINIEHEDTGVSEEVKNYTDNDLYYLAAAVCREAGGESEEIQLLVANIIINRVNSSIYPDTIYEVLTEYKQYGTMWKYGVSFPDWADQNVKDQCYSVAKRILEGERYCPENVLFQAEFEQGSGIFKQFGDDYYFCYYG